MVLASDITRKTISRYHGFNQYELTCDRQQFVNLLMHKFKLSNDFNREKWNLLKYHNFCTSSSESTENSNSTDNMDTVWVYTLSFSMIKDD